ncbi:MipA/OmpV family protein [Flavimaricola marinus]|uniref:MltA-interacting protein MipA n=1 Tax=Flavimaricola marinus TaxID=1819565 RepID=A0A238LIQ5_9RHOB|nr:MipA/OmpV family protein [Flavimaricola marinus]SMY09508.1 MltA-interacting protein MipA [Flavimaricola marinus]
MRFVAGTACIATLAAILSTPLGAQGEAEPTLLIESAGAGDVVAPGRNQLSFTLGAGALVQPGYFGSDEVVFGPTGSLSGLYLRYNGTEFGSADPDAIATGFGFGGSLRFVGERSAELYPELAGLDSIDPALELGGGVSYAQPAWQVFADLRFGIGGHESAVGEVGMDLIVRPTDDLTLTAGPRFFLGSDDYADTYFGVSPAEAAASGFDTYEAQGGLLSAGVALGANYDLGGPWGLNGQISWERLQGDAANSPIVLQGSADQFSAGIVATRRFSLEF